MNKQIKRRDFLKTSALGVGGLYASGLGAETYASQLLFLNGGKGVKPAYNSWSRLTHQNYGARRFSSFRYAPAIDRMLYWGYQAYNSWEYGSPERPWTGNKEYDMVAFNPKTKIWENHFPLSKQEEWSKNLPPMHLSAFYHGITPGHYRPQLKNRGGVLRPDLNIVADQVTYDSKRRQMVYFTGGRTLVYHVEDRQWSDIESRHTPPPVTFGSLCYDPKNDRIVLFGGGHVAETGPDGRLQGYTGTWAYDYRAGDWLSLEVNEEPPPRMNTRLVYDSRNEVMVVFGGDGQSCWRSDIWIFDVNSDRWHRVSSGRVPLARAGHFTIYDRLTGWVVIGGGYNYEELTDMWGYDVSSDSWHKLQGDVPVGWYVTADIIPEESTIILITSTKLEGDTRGCDETFPVRTTWTYPLKKQGLVVEGVAPPEERDLLKRPVEMAVAGTTPDDAHVQMQKKRIQNMPENRWVRFSNPSREAPVRTWGTCAFDTDKDRIIYWGGGHCGYGGSDYDFYEVDKNTWLPGTLYPEYPERAWNKGINLAGVTFSGAPWVRHGRKIYAYDPVSKKIINTKIIPLTSGYNPQPLKNVEPVNPDFIENGEYTRSSYTKWPTWVFHEETNKWEIICSGLPGLDLLVQTPLGVMGVDHRWGSVGSTNRSDMSVWNGQPMVDNSIYLLDVSGRKWKKLTLGGPWPQNLYEMTALIYDSRRNQILLHGGGENRDELWCFPLNTGRWEKLNPEFAAGTGGQPPVCRREAVYIPDDDVMLTAGQPGTGDATPAFWAYKVGENRWYNVDIELPEGKTIKDMLSQNRGWVYDPPRKIVLMVLGDSNLGLTGVYGLKFTFS